MEPQPSRDTSPLPEEATHGEETTEQVFHDAAARFLDVQIRLNETLETRNAGAFSVASAVLPVTFGLLGLAEREIPDRATTTMTVALVCYLLLVICSFRVTLIREFEFRPRLSTLRDNSGSGEYTPASLQQWVALEYLSSTEINAKLLQMKSRRVGAATTLLYAEAFLLSAAALWTLR